MHVVGGDGGAARLGGVEHLPHFGMSGSVRVLHVLQDDVAFGLVDSGEQFDALELDRLMGFGHVLAGDAVVAEHAVRRTGQVRHLCDMHGRRGREGRAGHVDRGGGGVHAGLGNDLAVCRRLAGLVVSTVGAGANGNVGAEVDACRVSGLDQRACDVGFGLADVDLTGTVEVTTQVAFDVLGRVFEHVHQLGVERVGGSLSAIALAFAGGYGHGALFAHGGRNLTRDRRCLAAVIGQRIFRVRHARAERTVRQQRARHRRIAVVLRVRIPDGAVVRVELEPVEAGNGDDEHVTIGPVLRVIASQALDGLHHRSAIVGHSNVSVEHAERAQTRVVVTARTIIRGRHDGQTRIIPDLHAIRRVGKRVERETHAIRASVTVRVEILAHIRHDVFRTVVVELGAIHDTILLRTLQTSVIAQTQKLVRISQNKPP